jgi:hypothetical protein
VARGYLNQPALTAARFVPDPLGAVPGARLYRSADRVRQLPDGALLFVGRADRQVKLRGYRIEPAEIEAVIRQLDGIKDCVVVPDPATATINALIVPAPEAPRHPSRPREEAERDLILRVRRVVAACLPGYMVPSRFVLLAALPLSPNGKLNHTALKEHLSERPDSAGGYVAPRTDLEEALALIWARTLGLERVGILDGFFSDLGGHSLLATQLIARIGRALRIDVPLRQIFVAQTIELFAAALLDRPPQDRIAFEHTVALYVKLNRMSDDEVDCRLAEVSAGDS